MSIETDSKLLLFFGLMTKNKKRFINHVVISDDEGKTFNTIIDTKIEDKRLI